MLLEEGRHGARKTGAAARRWLPGSLRTAREDGAGAVAENSWATSIHTIDLTRRRPDRAQRIGQRRSFAAPPQPVPRYLNRPAAVYRHVGMGPIQRGGLGNSAQPLKSGNLK